MRCHHTPPRAAVGEYRPGDCRRCWIGLNRAGHPAASGGPGKPSCPRPDRCRHLGERVEFRAGCSTGWMCRHACGSGRRDAAEHLGGVMEATPGDDCQDCPAYEPKG